MILKNTKCTKCGLPIVKHGYFAKNGASLARGCRQKVKGKQVPLKLKGSPVVLGSFPKIQKKSISFQGKNKLSQSIIFKELSKEK